MYLSIRAATRHRIDETAALYLAESGLHYALNRIGNTCWLSDIAEPGTRLWDREKRFGQAVAKNEPIRQCGHYLHYAGQPPEEVFDIEHFTDHSAPDHAVSFLPEGGGFKVWASPTAFREDGSPVWNACWDLISTGIYRNIERRRECRIQTRSFDCSHILFADRRLTLIADPEVPTQLAGSIWNNGSTYIGNSVRIRSEHEPCTSLGPIHVSGEIWGDVRTSSILFNTFQPDPSKDAADPTRFISGGIRLESAFERVHDLQRKHGYFHISYRVAGGGEESACAAADPTDGYRCVNQKFFPDYSRIDAANRVQCTDGYGGFWIDLSPRPDHRFIAAGHPGEEPDSTRTVEWNYCLLDRDEQEGDRAAVNRNMTHSVPSEPVLLRRTMPGLDWRHLFNTASASPETCRISGPGTVFDSWEAFTDYIHDDRHQLVTHVVKSGGNHSVRILVGRYNDRLEPLDPVVIYIRKQNSDEEKPDTGCFGVLMDRAELEINGSLICERGFDLRDLDGGNSVSGRWREFTTGKDGRVVSFCGGMPLIPAVDSNACLHFGLYRWCRDGAGPVRILGYPGIPAVASMGDIWIANREHPTVIEGPLYAPEGQILISNPPFPGHQPAVSIRGYVMGRDIDITGPVRIQSDPRYSTSDYFRILDCSHIRVVQWESLF
ncbi:hypothetical protein JXA40_06540 [bacterium]|nr:hypothetical protein [candidate division CSSED10-310 bacterium]